jgi:Class II flagellar assembly regulator
LRIEGTSARGQLRQRSKTRGGSKGGKVFQTPTTENAAQARTGGRVQAAGGIDAILALQGVEDPRFAKKKAVRHGQSMLDALEAMKVDLLAGRVGEGHLNKLMALVSRARQQADPDLEALIDDIELRARVELAKQGRFTS